MRDPSQLDTVAAQIAQRYGVPTEAIAQRLRKGRFQVKSDVDADTARQLVNDLQRLGAICSVHDNAKHNQMARGPVSLVPQKAPIGAQPSAAKATMLGVTEHPVPGVSVKRQAGTPATNVNFGAPVAPPPAPPAANATMLGVSPTVQQSTAQRSAPPSGPSQPPPAAKSTMLGGLAPNVPSTAPKGTPPIGSPGDLSVGDPFSPPDTAFAPPDDAAFAPPDDAAFMPPDDAFMPPGVSNQPIERGQMHDPFDPNTKLGISAADADAAANQRLGAIGDDTASFHLSTLDGDDVAAEESRRALTDDAFFAAPAEEDKDIAVEKVAAPAPKMADDELMSLDEVGIEEEEIIRKVPLRVTVASNFGYRYSVGLFTCLLLGFLLAHVWGSIRESTYDDIDDTVRTEQALVDSPVIWDTLDDQRAIWLSDKYDKRDTIAIESIVVWLFASGALFALWLLKLPWRRWSEMPDPVF